MARKKDAPRVWSYPGGLDDEFPNGPPTAVIEDRGLKLVLRFGEGDVAGSGPIQEIWLQSDTQPLEVGALGLMPSSATYFQHARAHMALLGSTEGTPAELEQRFRDTLKPFLNVVGPGRGHSDAFYRILAEEYKANVAEGNLRPVTTIARNHSVTISAASRWLKETRRRGYIDHREEADDAS
jgi:hypothetical protein